MNLKNIKIFSQNICKNSLIIHTILEIHSAFNIIFIQEPSWTYICSISSLSNCDGKELVGVSNHPNQITFSRILTQSHDSPRVIIYINIHISFLHFSLCNDIFNHRDISYISFFNHSSIYYLFNVYSNLSQSALKYFKNTEDNLNNVIILIGNFNIRNCLWDSNFQYCSLHRDTLFDIADFFQLEISRSTEFFPTRYSDNSQDSNSVLDLVFL